MSLATEQVVSTQNAFTVNDWDLALPLMQAIADLAEESGGTHYDWTRADNQILWRNTFTDANAMLAQLDAMESLLGALVLPGVASQDRYQVFGPSEGLAKISASSNSVDAEYFDSGAGFRTGYFSKTGTDEALQEQHGLCTSHPTFNVTDWAAAAPLLDAFIENTAGEAGCTYFGWSRSGSKLTWHGNYVNGDALRDHFLRAGPLVAALQNGPATMSSIEIHGPADELAKARPSLDAQRLVIEPKYFESEHRVKRLTKFFERGGAVEKSTGTAPPALK